jgi:D-psicose/D-tagatose/L-ribulose 3-epimerase
MGLPVDLIVIPTHLSVWRPVAVRPDDVIEIGLPFLKEEAKKAGLSLG